MEAKSRAGFDFHDLLKVMGLIAVSTWTPKAIATALNPLPNSRSQVLASS